MSTIPGVGHTGEGSESSDNPDIFRASAMKEHKKYRARLFAGPFTYRQVLYPTIAKDDMGKPRFSMRAVVQQHDEKYNHFFSLIAKLEKELQAASGIKQTKARLRAGKTFFYIGLVRGDEKAEWTIIEFKFKMQQQLEAIEKQESTRAIGYLENGPYYLYDLILEKKVDPTKSKFTGTSYHVSIADVRLLAEQDIMDKIPIDTPFTEIHKKFGEVVEKAFTPADMEFFKTEEGSNKALDEKKKIVEEIREHWDDEKCYKLLEEFPLNLFAWSNNEYEFHEPVKLFGIIQEKTDIKLLDGETVKELQDALKAENTASNSGGETVTPEKVEFKQEESSESTDTKTDDYDI